MRVRDSYSFLPSTSAPPLSLFLSLYNASTTLAARSLMSGTSAGADWADARVRESGSRLWLSSYSGNRASNPREEGERSGAQRSAWVLPPSGGPSSPFWWQFVASLLTPRLSLSGELGVRSATIPSLPVPHFHQLLSQVTATSHLRQEANLRCLGTNPLAPPHYLPQSGEAKTESPVPSPSSAFRPPVHNFL